MNNDNPTNSPNQRIPLAFMLNNILLVLLLLSCICIGFVLLPIREHNLISILVFVAIIIGLVLLMVGWNRKRNWAFGMLLVLQIPFAMITGAMLIIWASYVGDHWFWLAFVAMLVFMVLNTYALNHCNVVSKFTISDTACTKLTFVSLAIAILLFGQILLLLLSIY